MTKKNSGPVTLRDSLDFRDKIYQPALIQLPEEVIPEKNHIHIRDQSSEGTCTGFGLAAVIDYLNSARNIKKPVSSRMLYEVAKRYDRWPGNAYEGSTIRAAMKGWSKHGVCFESSWKYKPNTKGYLSSKRQDEALQNPLGAYYRVLPKRSDIHAALAEAKALYASATIHKGWNTAADKIKFKKAWMQDETYGHAFAILGYNDEGFIVQNSWGKSWGGISLDGKKYEGLSLWAYEDFELNIWDIWVARMAWPVESLSVLQSIGFAEKAGSTEIVERAPPQTDIRDYYVHIDDGQFDPEGDYPSSREETRNIIQRALLQDKQKNPHYKHILLYAHGGLNTVKGSAMRVAKWQPVFEANGIYGIHFIWETGLLAELRDILLGKNEFIKQRAGGIGDWWDNWVEKVTYPLGHPLWKEMCTDAEIAFKTGRDGTWFARELINGLKSFPSQKRPQLHLAGHSAGSVWFAHFLRRWMAQSGPAIENATFFAPACTHGLFASMIKPALVGNKVKNLYHLLLDDKTERDDSVAAIYRKSLLYLVSRSYEKKGEVVPIMGMERHLENLPDEALGDRIKHYITNKHPNITQSESHGDFDNDAQSMNSLLRFILGARPVQPFTKSDLEGY